VNAPKPKPAPAVKTALPASAPKIAPNANAIRRKYAIAAKPQQKLLLLPQSNLT
jgi:hypothetical protein